MEYQELIKDYLDDAERHLQVFDSVLLGLERDGFDREAVLGVLGELHTLKGNSGMMGYESLKKYIHEIEQILKDVCDSGVVVPEVLGALLESANTLRSALYEIAKGPGNNPELSAAIPLLHPSRRDNAQEGQRPAMDFDAYIGSRTDTIKVDFKRLNNLLDLVGELVIFKTRLTQIEKDIREEMQSKTLTKELNEGLELMGKTIAELQEGIMRARMLPVRHVFGKFTRMVRDLANSQGKRILLAFEGEETELDKTVIDELEQPLLHIIRNAVDHGLETPEERLAKGKNSEGTIILSAIQESNYVIIRVRDNGKGIDAEAVRESAVRKGLLHPEDPCDHDRVLSLIFSAGFSTKHDATDVSGRGIGLDVVGKNIAKLNGQIVVDSVPGEGTVFTIKLPLSLAIIPALMVETCGETYAVPMTSVSESIKISEGDIHIINNREVIMFRGRVIPVVRLHEFFRFASAGHVRFYAVILGRGEKSVALIVDRLRGQQEIVIKPLDETFGKSLGIAGASILGDGRIVLILDPMSFFGARETVALRR